MKLSLTAKINIGFAITMSILITISAISYRNIKILTKDSAMVEHTYVVLMTLEDIFSSLNDMESGVRGYVLSGKDYYLKPYHSATANIELKVKDLIALTAEKPKQQRALDALSPLIANKITIINEKLELRKNKGFEAALEVFLMNKGKRVMDDIRMIIDTMRHEENTLLRQRTERAKTHTKITIFTIATGNSLVIAFTFFTLIVIKRNIKQHEYDEEEVLKYTWAIEQSPVAVIITDLAGNLKYINPAFSRITGYTSAEAIGKNPRILKSGEMPPEEYKHLWHTILSGNDWKGEFHNRKKTGELYWASSVISPVKNRDGNIIYFLSISEDITERRRMDDALRERTKLALLTAEISVLLTQGKTMQSVLQGCTGSIVKHLDAAFARIWTLNERENMLELQASAGMYTHINGPHSRVPVGKLKIGLIAQERKPHLTNAVIGDPRIGDQEWARREGMVAFAGYPLVVEDNLVGVIAMFSRKQLNETTLKALESVADTISLGIRQKRADETVRNNEARIRTILDTTVDGIITIDERGIVESFNTAAEKIFGYRHEEVIGNNVNMLMPEPYYSEHDRYMANYLRTGIKKIIGIGRELVGKRKDGTIVPIDLAVSEVRLDNRRIFTGIIRDITARKLAEEELKKAKEAAEQATQAKSAFLANVSHEIRTPMNAIMGMTELALGTELTPEQRGFLKVVQSSSESLLHLIDDILDFSKIEAGRIEIENAGFNLRETIETIAETMNFRATEKGIELVCYVDPTLPTLLIGDKNRLRQIIINLVDNAIKFTEKGEVAIRVEPSAISTSTEIDGSRRLQPAPAKSQGIAYSHKKIQIHFSVSDTGIGISKADQEKLFKTFSQVDASTTRKYGGTGLGLSISKALVELMGGKIWVESEAGKGSTFHFSLPFELQSRDATSCVSTTAEEFITVREEEKVEITKPAEVKPAKTHLKILLAEDNVDNQKLANTILKKADYSVDIAENGKLAVDAVQKHHYDLILMDIAMPEMEGFAATAEIRRWEKEQNRERIPIVALTAYALQGYREKCLEGGMDDYITKPLKKNTLLDTVNK